FVILFSHGDNESTRIKESIIRAIGYSLYFLAVNIIQLLFQNSVKSKQVFFRQPFEFFRKSCNNFIKSILKIESLFFRQLPLSKFFSLSSIATCCFPAVFNQLPKLFFIHTCF